MSQDNMDVAAEEYAPLVLNDFPTWKAGPLVNELQDYARSAFKAGAHWAQEQTSARVKELEVANANCISLLLHESRMENLERQQTKLLLKIGMIKDLTSSAVVRKICEEALKEPK